MQKQQYIAKSVSWVLRLTLLDLQANWTYKHTLRMECVHMQETTSLQLRKGLSFGHAGVLILFLQHPEQCEISSCCSPAPLCTLFCYTSTNALIYTHIHTHYIYDKGGSCHFTQGEQSLFNKLYCTNLETSGKKI